MSAHQTWFARSIRKPFSRQGQTRCSGCGSLVRGARLKAEQAHQSSRPAAPDAYPLAAKMANHLAGAVERILQEQIVDPPHQRQRLRTLPRRLVVERRPPDRQQTALPAQAQRRMVAHHHRPPLGPAQRPDPRDKKSRSTINSPILA